MSASLKRLLFAGRGLRLGATALCLSCAGNDQTRDACTPNDADGIISEPARLLLTVSDAEFVPKILTTQNSSTITLTLQNEGTTPHSFVVDCLPTPNSDGCPTQSCFSDLARIDPVAPGQQATVVFESPLVEGIYSFHSDVPEDTALVPGQFIIQ